MRELYIILAFIVDANGAYHTLDGYPKLYDSKNYSGDTEKTMLRATGDFHEIIGTMCKNDTRKLQTVIMVNQFGYIINSFTTGSLAEPGQEEV